MKPISSLFEPILAGATLGDRLAACLTAAAAIALTMILCAGTPWAAMDPSIIVAPLGASAVLVFAVPASPLAQPWPVIGGNVVSSLVGVAAYRLVGDVRLAAGIAVGGAILAMSLLRCLHPPGGAAALTAVIGGQGIHAAGFGFALVPVGINSVVLVVLGIILHRTTGHRYPRQTVDSPPVATPSRFASLGYRWRPGGHARKLRYQPRRSRCAAGPCGTPCDGAGRALARLNIPRPDR